MELKDYSTEEEFQCFDAWSYAWLKKQGETSPILSNSSNTVKNEQKSADKIEQ